MDLGAYANIERLEQVMKHNEISVPRIRGLRLMSEEDGYSIEEVLNNMFDEFFYRDFVESRPIFSIYPCCYVLSSKTKKLEKKYLTKDKRDIRWDRLHGKKRKNAKYVIKRKKRRIELQYNMFNMFAGRDDVLYIHARIGGPNWNYYGGPELEQKDWFLAKVEDALDNTYCDIYAKIDTVE